MNENYHWLQFPNNTCLLSFHPDFPKQNEKYLNYEKETKEWKLVASIYPPEHYGLKEIK